MKKKLFVATIIILITIGLFFFFSFKSFVVSGTSMEPSFKDGEKILVYKWEYSFKEAKRGDVVLVEIDGEKMIKRVVGLPGEMVEIKDGNIYIDNNKITEYYVSNTYTFANQRVSLQDNQYYLLGDNREANQSIDSRIFGPVSVKKIIGRVVYQMDNGLKPIGRGNYAFGQ